MKARRLFYANKVISQIPIVDNNKRIIGAFSRNDDYLFKHFVTPFFSGEENAKVFLKKFRNVFIVSPNKEIYKNTDLVFDMERVFINAGCNVKIIKINQIYQYLIKNNTLIFIDGDELIGIRALYGYIRGLENGWKKVISLRGLAEAIYAENEANLLKCIAHNGVHVITLYENTTNNTNKYWKKINYEIDEKFKRIGKRKAAVIYEELWRDFYDDTFCADYAESMSTNQYSIAYDKNFFKLDDAQSIYYNVKNGERITVGQPKKYNKTIYFFGPCIIVGWGVADKYTMESYLQELYNQAGYQVKVINYGCWGNKSQLLRRVCATKFAEGDVAIIYFDNKCFDGIPAIDLAKSLERENAPSNWFCDSPIHVNHNVYKIWANEIFDSIPFEWLTKKEKSDFDARPLIRVRIKKYIERYFGGMYFYGEVGSIVVNCNPFTLGHRYLIEKALEYVEHLIIFVVEEDSSLFSFAERYAMVIEGTKDLQGITVVPSGEYVASSITFPEYFLKIEGSDLKRNTEYDISLFAQEIASRLNIKYRFAGEEKNDSVTNAYNLAMKKILPLYDINFIEIPRRMNPNTGNPISASVVRDRLECGEDISELVPESTIKVLALRDLY